MRRQQRKPMNDNPDMPAGEALNPRARATDPWGEERATALLVLADGTVIEGKGAGATASPSAKSASTPP